MTHGNYKVILRLVLHCKGYVKYGGICPHCGCTNTYIDYTSGIHWCGNCDYEW